MIEEDKISDPFDKPYVDNYCNEKVPPEYLTREDIIGLGFLRSDPNKTLYTHTDKPNLYLLKVSYHNFGKKDIMDERIELFAHNGNQITELYSSTKPNKQDIQQIINNYAA